MMAEKLDITQFLLKVSDKIKDDIDAAGYHYVLLIGKGDETSAVSDLQDLPQLAGVLRGVSDKMFADLRRPQ
jgi:hypothetical protein